MLRFRALSMCKNAASVAVNRSKLTVTSSAGETTLVRTR